MTLNKGEESFSTCIIIWGVSKMPILQGIQKKGLKFGWRHFLSYFLYSHEAKQEFSCL